MLEIFGTFVIHLDMFGIYFGHLWDMFSLVIEGSTGVASRIAEGNCGNYQYLDDDS